MHEAFLRFAAAKLKQLTQRLDVCLGELTPEQIWWRPGETQNSAGNLVLHLCGNVGQWIRSAVGGAADARDRGAEFAARDLCGREQLLAGLRATVDEAARVIESLAPERLAQRVRVQGYDVTVLEAVFHAVEHFSYHAGQIIFLTKLLTGRDLRFYAHLEAQAHSEQTP